MGGHDFDDSHPEVKAAVLEFFSAEQAIYLTTDDSPPSWYVYKAGMPGSDWVRNPRKEAD